MVNGNGNHEHTEEAEAKQDGNGETDGGEESNEQEVIVIQDTGFTVKIQAPGTEPFDLQVRIAFNEWNFIRRGVKTALVMCHIIPFRYLPRKWSRRFIRC